MVLLYIDDAFAQHDTGAHPECIQRITRLNAQLELAGWRQAARCPPWASATPEQLQRVHQAAYLEQLRAWCAAAAGRIEADTVVSRGSWTAALRGAGAAMDAVTRVTRGEAQTAFCAIRPPGHHALPSGAMGFCLVNNVALAAHAALAAGLDRVLIIDWDVHHGNGTQDAFYRDGRVGFYSIHRSPFYPGTGAADETGSGPGLGWIKNAPVAADIATPKFFERFRRDTETLADALRPQLILLSAGFDAHRLDPVGSLCLEAEDFATLTRHVRQLAAVHCQGRIVSLLEGGYHLEHMPQCVLQHLDALADTPLSHGPHPS